VKADALVAGERRKVLCRKKKGVSRIIFQLPFVRGKGGGAEKKGCRRLVKGGRGRTVSKEERQRGKVFPIRERRAEEGKKPSTPERERNE